MSHNIQLLTIKLDAHTAVDVRAGAGEVDIEEQGGTNQRNGAEVPELSRQGQICSFV